MKFTTRSRYGTLLLMDIAMNEEEGPVSLRDISLRQEISLKYLEKLCRILRDQGYLESVAGSKGGYRLLVHPSAIRMGDVIFLLENGSPNIECDEDSPCCDRADTCLTRSIWNRAIMAMRSTLNDVSLEDMLRDACFCPKNDCSISLSTQTDGELRACHLSPLS